MTDPINPAHYKGSKMECIEAIEAAVEDKHGIEAVCVANVIRYLWRYRDKHPSEPSIDPRKARWYLDWLIETLETEEANAAGLYAPEAASKPKPRKAGPLPGEIVIRPADHGTMD